MRSIEILSRIKIKTSMIHRIIISAILLIQVIIVPAQITLNVDAVVQEKISDKLAIGDTIELLELGNRKMEEVKSPHARDAGREDIVKTMYKLKSDSKKLIIYKDAIDKIKLISSSKKSFWKSQAIKRSAYYDLLDNGMQYKLRNEAEEEALKFISKIKNNNKVFSDSYLENYIYTLIYEIYPTHLNDGRAGSINVLIKKNITPNSAMFPNGTLVVNTGLLSSLSCEDELIGVLAHEISHYVLDHQIRNINEAEKRAERAKFWQSLATGLAAVTETYIASNNPYYSLGALTLGTAAISYSLSQKINKRLGLKYSREQELEADECAKELMEFIGREPSAYSSALSKIKEYSIITGNHMALTDEGSHPAIDDRIELIGKPEEIQDEKYDKKISFVNTYNAQIEYNQKHFENCLDLVNRNIDAGVATEDDYILKAMVTMQLSNKPKDNKKALKYLQTADSLTVSSNINLTKQKSLAFIRLGRHKDAINSLKKYEKLLGDEQKKVKKIRSPSDWTSVNQYLMNEKDWTKRMIFKVEKM